MTRWVDPPPVNIPAPLGDLKLPPLVTRTLVRRGLATPEAVRAFLDPDFLPKASPHDLPGMKQAVARVITAMRKKQPVCVWGDFDVDGQTATTILVQTLQALGVEVSYHIPIRAVASHGVHVPQLKEIIDRGTQLIVTCDTGISAQEAVAYANSRGVDVIISDHHDLPEVLPQAAAVINSKLLPGDHPLAHLPGAGVAYKLAEALLEEGTSELERDSLLDLVALGIIADVALLTGETRALAQKGLEALRNSSRLGLQLLAELANQPLTGATEEYVGFVIGPRLNALGRLGDANPAVEFLLTRDPVRARVLATQLEGLNAQRKLLTHQVYQAAEAQLRADPDLLTQPAILLGHSAWPGGVIGIVASRLVERYHKPVILFNTPEKGPARGSARSVDGIHITQAIAAGKDLLLSYGGHPMAAGLSLEPENLPKFRRALGSAIERMLGEAAYEEPRLQIDAWLSLDELSLDLADSVEQLAPFGAGNPPLVFGSHGLILKSKASIGRSGEHLRLTVEDENGVQEKILWWNAADTTLPEGKLDLAYSLRASTFRGQRQLTLQFIDFRTVEEQVSEVKPSKIKGVDLRNEQVEVSQLSAQVFAEGEHERALDAADRIDLTPSKELVIYTTPPGPQELRAILEAVKPQKVYLVAKNPPPERPEDFLARLGGMAKFVIAKREGQTLLAKFAAAAAHRQSTVRFGLEWLAAGGHVDVTLTEDQVHLSPGSGKANPYLQKELFLVLKGLLEETQAYRQYFRTTQMEKLLP